MSSFEELNFSPSGDSGTSSDKSQTEVVHKTPKADLAPLPNLETLVPPDPFDDPYSPESRARYDLARRGKDPVLNSLLKKIRSSRGKNK
jgi:hypothetical protein